MTNEPNINSFFKDLLTCLIIALVVVGLCLIFSSCKVVSSLKKSTNDSLSVKKVNEGTSKSDSSHNSTDKTYTKETIYYQPIKDTTTNSIHITTPAPIIRIIETGHEQTQATQVIKDESWRESFDSLKVAILTLSQAKTTKVGFSTFEIIMLIVGGIVVLKMFAPSVIGLLTKIK